MNVESRSQGEHIAGKPRLWLLFFVVSTIGLFTIVSSSGQTNALRIGISGGAGITLYAFAAAKANQWAANGSGHVTSRPPLWFVIWLIVSVPFATVEALGGRELFGAGIYGVFVGVTVTVVLFLVAAAHRLLVPR